MPIKLIMILNKSHAYHDYHFAQIALIKTHAILVSMQFISTCPESAVETSTFGMPLSSVKNVLFCVNSVLLYKIAHPASTLP